MYSIISDYSNRLRNIFSKLNKNVCPLCSCSCCRRCAEANAYFYDETDPTHKLIHLYRKVYLLYLKSKYNWDKKSGFLGNNGCKLPGEKRSYICLKFICEKFIESSKRRDRQEVEHYASLLLLFRGY